jgi:hypothetical protein
LASGLTDLSLGRYDLACSLEVAEHLPEQTALSFVKKIADTADIILFGAAIPGQGGVNHVNEQYHSYWIKLFLDQGFEFFDLIRPQFWECDKISEDKRQNTVLFVRSNNPLCKRLETFQQKSNMIDVVHPVVLDRKVKQLDDLTRSPIKLLKYLMKALIGKRVISFLKARKKV